MSDSVFTSFQKEVFLSLSKNEFVRRNFYFTGGTALAEFYLHHRFSEDLDFFTRKEISFNEIRVNLEGTFKEINIQILEYREELSAKIFFLRKSQKEIIKTDFNYFPFKTLERGFKFRGIQVDSLLDIAVNKLHTILTRSNVRDYVDFYFIQKRQNYEIDYLLGKLEKKFRWKVDPLFLGSRFIRVVEIKDYPKMVIKLSQKDLINFFMNLGKKAKEKIMC